MQGIPDLTSEEREIVKATLRLGHIWISALEDVGEFYRNGWEELLPPARGYAVHEAISGRFEWADRAWDSKTRDGKSVCTHEHRIRS